MTPYRQRETIIEFRVSGPFAQVNAVDVATGIEVSVTVPARTAKSDYEALAFRKLAKALSDQGIVLSNTVTQENSGTLDRMPPPTKRGIIV